jgi:deoxyadenosine/deoxycytidine kinase
MSAALVSIIGAPAAGKTTLAEGLSRTLGAKLLREDYAGNPFLAESYQGRPEAQLPAQLYFLMSRVGQLSISSWPAEGVVVSDYGFCQDGIYAAHRLGEDDLRLYQRVAKRCAGLVQPPRVMIYLKASAKTLLERIHLRGRSFEASMTPEFLQSMQQAYDAAADAVKCPVLRIDGDQRDLRRREALDELVERVKEHL